MEPDSIMFSEVSQTKALYVTTYMWNINFKMHEYDKTEIDPQIQRPN